MIVISSCFAMTCYEFNAEWLAARVVQKGRRGPSQLGGRFGTRRLLGHIQSEIGPRRCRPPWRYSSGQRSVWPGATDLGCDFVRVRVGVRAVAAGTRAKISPGAAREGRGYS